MFIVGAGETQELRLEFHLHSGSETHFTPKGVSINTNPMAINIQPLRGWTLNGVNVG